MTGKSIGLVFCLACLSVPPLAAAQRWTELNIGPFYVYTTGDIGAARDALTQLEQTRWVLGGLLESKDLPSLWPIRIIYTNVEKTNPTPQFVWQNATYLLILPPGTRPPLDQIAGILLDANTPRLPEDAESGLRQLFATLEAKGSRVTWGGAPPHPDLAWARMQLLATKFEYFSDFHIFLATLKSGSTLRSAEQNAFGKDYQTIEKEVAANLSAGTWQPVPVSGRPLDPKRDLGEHSIDEAVIQGYLANGSHASKPNAGEAASLIKAGVRNAPVYVAAAENLPPDQALPLLKKAAQLNPQWAEPIYRQAQLATDPAEKENLLKKALQLEPREIGRASCRERV